MLYARHRASILRKHLLHLIPPRVHSVSTAASGIHVFGIISLLIRARGCLAPNAMTDLLIQKGKQIREAGKSLALTGVGVFD
jgi:hypothetical protein